VRSVRYYFAGKVQSRVLSPPRTRFSPPLFSKKKKRRPRFEMEKEKERKREMDGREGGEKMQNDARDVEARRAVLRPRKKH